MKSIYSLLCALLFSVLTLAQSWETNLPSLPGPAVPRHHPATFSINGIGYLVAGANVNDVSLDDFYSYDPITNSWTAKADFPGPARGFSYAVNSDTKGYLGFGYLYDPINGFDQYLSDLWEYDPLTDSWTELASCPGPSRIHPAMVYLNGKIFMGLGGSSLGDLGDWWEYDIDSDSWSVKATFPGPNRHHPYYFAIGDYVYVGMGHRGPDIYNDLYRYDPSTDSWTQVQSLPSQGRVAGTQFSYNGKGYLLSGQGETHENLPTGEFWEYDPIADDWTQLSAHPGGGRWAPGSFIVNDGIYFVCGEANSGVQKDMMRYQIGGFTELLNEDNEQAQLTVVPNPSQGQFKIANLTESAQLTVVDINGKTCWESTVYPEETIELSFLEKGVYFGLINGAGVADRIKLVID